MEIEPDPIGAQLGAGNRVVDARHTADLHADHGKCDTPRSVAMQQRGCNHRPSSAAMPRPTSTASRGSRRTPHFSQRLFELVLDVDPDQAIDFFAVLEEHHGRNREMRRLPGMSWFSSQFILPTLTLPSYSAASFSMVGARFGKARTRVPRNRRPPESENPAPPTSSFRR